MRMPMKVIAHRGGSKEVFENSSEAIEHAISIGCDSIEVDLRQTKDGEIILMHDETLNRTTNSRGRLRNIPASDLKTIRLKSGSKIPALKDLLTLSKNKISLHLEVKERGFEARLVSAIVSLKMMNAVTVISFDWAVLKTIHDINPKIKTGFLFAFPTRTARIPKFCSVILPHWTAVGAELVSWAHKKGLEVHVWTVNNLRTARRLAALGVNGLITDIPSSLWGAKRHVPLRVKSGRLNRKEGLVLAPARDARRFESLDSDSQE